MSEYCKNCYELAEQLHRYKQAIEGIKEIAEDNFYYLDSEKRWVLNKIIQKCEEVEK